MTRFFRKRNEGLEDRLRSLQGEPRSDFVRELSGEIRARRVPATVRTKRFAAALVTSALMVIPFVAFGGVSYASSAASQAVSSVAHNESKGDSTDNRGGGDQGDRGDRGGNHESPDEDQYEHGKKCGHDDHQLVPGKKPCPPQAGKKDD